VNQKITALALIICLAGCNAEVEPIEYPDSLVKAEIAGEIWEATFVGINISDIGIGFVAYDSPTLEKRFGLLSIGAYTLTGGVLPLRPMELSEVNGATLNSFFEIPNEGITWYGRFYPSQIKFFIDSVSSFNSTFNEYTLAHGRFEAYACNGDNRPICVAPKGTFTNVPVFEGEGRGSYFLSINANYYKKKLRD